MIALSEEKEWKVPAGPSRDLSSGGSMFGVSSGSNTEYFYHGKYKF